MEGDAGQIFSGAGINIKEKRRLNFDNNVNKTYHSVIVEIAEITVNTSAEYRKGWEIVLLTLYDNKTLFTYDKQTNFEDFNALFNFLRGVRRLFSENQYVTCGCGPFVKLEDCLLDSDTSTVPPDWIVVEDTEDFSNHKAKLNHFFAYKKLEFTVTSRTENAVDKGHFDKKLSMYWDGNTLNFNKALDYSTTFHLQDMYDNEIFFIKWVTSLVYSKLLDIFYIMVEKTYNLSDDDKLKLSEINLRGFSEINFLKHTIVKPLLEDFVSVTISFDPGNIEKMKNILEIQRNEFKFLGLKEYVQYFQHPPVSVRITNLVQLIDDIVKFFKK